MHGISSTARENAGFTNEDIYLACCVHREWVIDYIPELRAVAPFTNMV